MFFSKHFELEKVSEGIYAAIAKEGGGAVANAGFVDLGDQTIVFDTFNTQQAAEDLKNMAITITNRPITWVIKAIGMETISEAIKFLRIAGFYQVK